MELWTTQQEKLLEECRILQMLNLLYINIPRELGNLSPSSCNRYHRYYRHCSDTYWDLVPFCPECSD